MQSKKGDKIIKPKKETKRSKKDLQNIYKSYFTNVIYKLFFSPYRRNSNQKHHYCKYVSLILNKNGIRKPLNNLIILYTNT